MSLSTLYTHTHTIRYTHSDETRTVYVQFEREPSLTHARTVIGCLSYDGTFADLRPLAGNKDAYGYTHGGDEYRAACRAAWAWLASARADWFAASDGEHVWGVGDSPAAALTEAKRELDDRYETGDPRVSAILATLHWRPISAERRAAILSGDVAERSVADRCAAPGDGLVNEPVGAFYDHSAAIGVAIERWYRGVPVAARADALEQIGRSVGAALSRVDGRRRGTHTEPSFLAPTEPRFRGVPSPSPHDSDEVRAHPTGRYA